MCRHLRVEIQLFYKAHFMSKLQKLDKWLKHNPSMVPNIQEFFLELEGFQYTMDLDLNMGCYHIYLSEYSSNQFTIVILRGKYEYLQLLNNWTYSKRRLIYYSMDLIFHA